ncbi:MAG: hypothetical protein JWN52_7963 [Actinomycetia bacterium]|nr:hypothetical protein [Actinomycetes bacterium]
MAEAWEPVSEVEHRMSSVLQSGDQEAYFRLLAQAELLVPVPPDQVEDVLANQAQPSWPTSEADGRTHVLAYTSPEAMRACLGPRFQHFMKLKFGDIAGAWPDNRWWLAVDAGLPIQGHLPSWFVRQLADGDARPPQAGIGPVRIPVPRPASEPPPWEALPAEEFEPDVLQSTGETTPPPVPATTAEPAAPTPAAPPPAAPPPAEVGFQPAGELERALLEAGERGDDDAYMKVLLGAEVLVPIPADLDGNMETGPHPGRPDFPWQLIETDGRTAISMFTSVERLQEAIGTAEFLRFPFAVVIRHWPNVAWSLSVNPGTPVGASLPGEQLPGLAEWADQQSSQRMAEQFEPQNDVEERLFDAITRRDLDAFFKILLSGQVLVPAEAETPWGTKPDDPDFPWLTVPVQNRPSIMAFTSLKWMHDAIGQSRFVMPEVHDLVSAWANPDWTFVLNPGTPIDATVPGDQVRALADRPESAAPPEFEPGNRIDQELFEAAEANDTDAFLRVLFAANVLVPIAADAPLEVTPTEPEFRWDAAMRGESSVQVFTSLVRLREALIGSESSARFVYTDFRELIRHWPRAEWTMLLNPGTRIGASLRGDQVHALSEWSAQVGLMKSAAQVETRSQPVQPAQAPAEPVAAASPLRSGGTTRSGPAIMQKVLPAGHVAWYLEQGYDRVGGFVHPSSDVSDLQTPVQLYEALGLLYEGSPFSLADEGAYIMRWPAYCEDLYRIPFGGQTEEELRGWGDSGWVVEQAPFQGTGFASGSGGTIREYKVDSTRLPYGAEMYYLGRDRSERFIAMYDPDQLTWLQSETVETQ